MLGFQYHAHPARRQVFVQRFSDLLGEPLLELQSPREDVDGSRQLGEADNMAIRG